MQSTTSPLRHRFGVLLLQKEERLHLIIINIRLNKSVIEILKYNIAIGISSVTFFVSRQRK
jgi:hypothetical protein